MSTTADHIKQGRAHHRARQYGLAIECYNRAIGIDPNHAGALNDRARALLASGRRAEALASCTKATTLSPNWAPGWITLAEILSDLLQHDLALKAYRKAQKLAPDRAELPGRVLQQMTLCCDWDGIDSLIANIDARLAAGESAIQPFYWHAISASPQSHLLAAVNFQRALPHITPESGQYPATDTNSERRIRIGYVSGELNLSPNGLVMAGIFDHHDREQFEVIAFDNGHERDTALRRRIVGSFDRVIDVREMTDSQMARAMREEKIDIAVDLNGFFGNSRSTVFGHRPAPVQVSYLGCPATSGSMFFDYIIADEIVVPESERQFYTEKIIYMPESYYPTDRQREIDSRPISRADCGLPDTAFVFCCFNYCHKILPETFASWMRILAQVDGSVLWLLDANPTASANLRSAAARHGVDPARLIFAPRRAPDSHLARHRCADLFLDTLPYNAHTTATDALWAGLPVLTLKGTTYAGRVASSLLLAMRLPELIAESRSDYERRAVELATQPGRLASLHSKLQSNRLTTPLFDTARFTRHLENAYRAIHRRRCEGLAPDLLYIGNSDQDN